MQKYKVAVYIRLSKEDKIKDESNSVTNQKSIIESYIKKNEDLELIDFYIDDGYSGTTFDRPEYKRMFKDIIDGHVNTVIVNDLSRFGRNHIESDNYLENILPGYNVRFISIIDEIDSSKNPKSVSSIAVPLKT
ncbi:MAG: recombinase family protein [Bacilli bacterium]